MRTLGIDYGTKRVGLALSDELGLIALPLEVVPAEPRSGLLGRLREIIGEKHVAEVVLGLPRNMDGSYGPAAENAREFAALLQSALSIPVRTWDERLTSAQANRFLIQAEVRRARRRQKADQTAAAILLQSYLDARQHSS